MKKVKYFWEQGVYEHLILNYDVWKQIKKAAKNVSEFNVCSKELRKVSVMTQSQLCPLTSLESANVISGFQEQWEQLFLPSMQAPILNRSS